MTKLLLSYHQVMPGCLDFIVTFGNRHYAQEFPYTGFRHQLRLSDSSRGQMIRELGRSGRDLSLCFNLRSVERSRDKWPWAIRQTAVYHSFDTLSGRATWIVTKANLLMEKRIQSATIKKIPTEIAQFETNSEAFSANLFTHLIFADWAGENWRWYIDFLEEEAQNLTRHVLQTSVQKPEYSAPTAPSSPQSPPTRTSTFFQPWGHSSIHSEKTLVEDRSPHSPGHHPSIRTNLFSKVRSEQLSPAQIPDRSMEASPAKANEEVFCIDDLQKNQFLEDKTNEAMLIIDANLNILEELVKFYKNMLKSGDCPQEIQAGCQANLLRFETRVEGVQNDLRMQKSRAKAILRLLSDRKSLLFGILEYQNMVASRVSAEKAQASADEMRAMTQNMHEIALQTKQETVSMRIITLVTLFFLPGTFISVGSMPLDMRIFADENRQTLMSTDIIRWQSDLPGQGEPQKTVSLGALQFFMAITVPLMLVTFLAWFIVYRCVKRKDEHVRRPDDLEAQPHRQYQAQRAPAYRILERSVSRISGLKDRLKGCF